MLFTSIWPIPENSLVAVAGGGGKTSLLRLLETELRRAQRNVITTVTTRIGRGQLKALEVAEIGTLDEALAAARRAAQGQRILLGRPPRESDRGHGGLSGVPVEWFPRLREEAPMIWLVEADGSAGRPVKAHRPDEPVLPPPPRALIMILGATALTTPWKEAIHRPEIFELSQPLPNRNRALSPEELSNFVIKAWKPLAPDLIFINQIDALPERRRGGVYLLVENLVAAGFAVASGSLERRTFHFWEGATGE